MNKYYFETNVMEREFVLYCFEDNGKGTTLSLQQEETARISFNDLIYMIEEYSQGEYQQQIQTIFELMYENVDRGRTINNKISDMKNQMDSDFGNNLLARICLNTLYISHNTQRYFIKHLGLLREIANIISQRYFKYAKKQIKNTLDDTVRSMNELINITENDFKHSDEQLLFSNAGYIVIFENRKSRILYSLNESISPLVHFFTSSIHAAGLNVYHCLNCNKKYLDNNDMGYCPSEVCQEEKRKQLRRIERKKRKDDPYKNAVDDFNNFFRQQTHILKEEKISSDAIEEFKEEGIKCQYDVKMEISVYQDTLKPLPQEIFDYIDSQKKYLKKVRDDMLKRFGKKRSRGRRKKSIDSQS